jgi:hypothetical protein
LKEPSTDFRVLYLWGALAHGVIEGLMYASAENVVIETVGVAVTACECEELNNDVEDSGLGGRCAASTAK